MQDILNFKDLYLDDMMNEETEFIPLITSEEEDEEKDAPLSEILPVLTLKNTVLFPGVVIPITVGRDKSIKLIQETYKNTKTIAVASQKDSLVEDPNFDDLHNIACVGSILKVLRMPDGNTTVIIQGKRRCSLEKLVTDDPYIKAEVNRLTDKKAPKRNKAFNALVSSLKDMSLQIIKDSPNIPSDASFAIKNIESASFLVNFIASNMTLTVQEKQQMLEEGNVNDRATKVLAFLTKEIQLLELKNEIQSKVKVDIDNQQKEYFLNQQIKTIQEELGVSGPSQEIEELEKRAKLKKWDEGVEKHFYKELEKLQRVAPQAAEYSVYMNYLELLLDLPWNEYTKDKFDLKRAKKVLDKDHYGLDEVKDRILEHLAVLKLKKDMKAPILCLYGPP
ncbi:MAG: ATP-dependent Lon protease, partial [Glaciecola sp.]